MASPLLKLTGVGKSYNSADGGVPIKVLENISLEINAAESVAIVGPSGSGKSTLLNIIGTLDRPTTGTVTLDGQDLTQLDEVALAQVRNRRIGFVFQSHHLLPQCSVLENVLVPTLADRDHVSRAGAVDRATQWLNRIGLGERLTHRPGQLSGGERQRVAVIRALINRPSLLLADEPTGALDRASAENIAELLVRLNREEHVTLITVTHAPDLAKRMGRLLELRDGRIASTRVENA
jgi:ABC-type lipoprotein export system ATPase subunit